MLIQIHTHVLSFLKRNICSVSLQWEEGPHHSKKLVVSVYFRQLGGDIHTNWVTHTQHVLKQMVNSLGLWIVYLRLD